jgi:predicted ABC-type exoprotein transport system permease subunit
LKRWLEKNEMPAKEEEEMYQFLSGLSQRDLLVRQVPSFSLAFLLASLFYRFGSFALESVAFLATWFVLDAAWGLILRFASRGR